jgi:hypothetical protein
MREFGWTRAANRERISATAWRRARLAHFFPPPRLACQKVPTAQISESWI